MTITYRDIIRKQEKKLDQKQNKRSQFRAVITDELGNQSGAGEIWFDRARRKVWAMPIGGTQPFPYYCYRLKPVIGLGVIVGYSSPLNQYPEILQTDTELLAPSNVTGSSYEAPDNEDFSVGGRLQLWLDTRLIQSLAIYPSASGLEVNVTNGDYIYQGVRKTFGGQTGIDLSGSQPAGPDEHLYVGLYLDSSNELQTVDGATVATSADAPEPTWPAGAYKLGMVLLNDAQTVFSMADDVVNLKIPWTDEESFGGDVAGDTHAAASKTTPVDADEIPLADSAASYALKKLTWANLKATLLTWLNGLTDPTKISKLYRPSGASVVVTATNGDRIGINQSSPDTSLHVVGDVKLVRTSAAQLTLQNSTPSNSDGARDVQISFVGTNAGGSDNIMGTLLIEHDGAGNDTKGRVLVNVSNGSSVNEVMRIDSAGGVKLTAGAAINEFSTDGTMAGNSDLAVPTEKAVKTYVDGLTGGNAVYNGICEGRLTLASGTAVTTADVTAATTIYFTPFRGNRVALYTSGVWAVYALTEKSLSLSGLTADKNNDVFLYDNSGTLTLERVQWTNDSIRATALTTQDGVLVKSGETNKRYLGTFRTTGTTGQCEDSFAKRYVWNYYNRCLRPMKNAVETANSWTYTTATFREANGSTTNRLQFVVGVAEDRVEATVLHAGANSTGPAFNAGIGLDSTTVNSALMQNISPNRADAGIYLLQAFYKGFPAAGYHFLSWLEKSNTGGTTTWYGDAGDATIHQSGISGELLG